MQPRGEREGTRLCSFGGVYRAGVGGGTGSCIRLMEGLDRVLSFLLQVFSKKFSPLSEEAFRHSEHACPAPVPVKERPSSQMRAAGTERVRASERGELSSPRGRLPPQRSRLKVVFTLPGV